MRSDSRAGQCRGRRARSDGADLCGLRPLRALGDVVLDLLVFLERTVTGRLDCREVNEDVCASVIGCDETEALVRVEPLYGARSHLLYILRDEPEIRAPRADQLRIVRPPPA